MITGCLILLGIVIIGVATCKIYEKPKIKKPGKGECEGDCGKCYRCGI